jgi:hypothetical protein
MFDKDKKYPEIIQQKKIAESFEVSYLDLHFKCIGALTLHRAAI